MHSHDLKLHRALEHLGALHAASQGYIERQPCGLRYECEVETRDHILRFVVRQPPPDSIRVLAADCIQNLRQSLDHLAYQLAIRLSGKDPPPNEASSGFPIHNSASAFNANLGKKIAEKRLIPPDLRTQLEALQPYNGGDAERLRTLRDLDDACKHRSLPIAISVGQFPQVFTRGINVKSALSHEWGPVEHGTEVLRFTAPDPNMSVGLGFTAEVTFGEGPAENEIVAKFVAETRQYLLGRIVRPIGDQFL